MNFGELRFWLLLCSGLLCIGVLGGFCSRFAPEKRGLFDRIALAALGLFLLLAVSWLTCIIFVSVFLISYFGLKFAVHLDRPKAGLYVILPILFLPLIYFKYAEFLKLHNFKPKTYTDEQAASANTASDMQRGEYPLLLTPLDTSGEKPYEEFIGHGERAIEVGLKNLLAIPFQSSPKSLQHLRNFMTQVEAALDDPNAPFDKSSAVQTISQIIPEFTHIETGRTLDDRR